MPEAFHAQSRTLALELHRLLQDIDPTAFREKYRERVRARVSRIRLQLRDIHWPQLPEMTSLRERFSHVETVLAAHAPSEDADVEQQRSLDWGVLRTHLAPAYDALIVGLRRRKIDVPVSRPTNWTRQIFHVFSATVAVLLVEEFLTRDGLRWVSSVFAGSFWLCEIIRPFSEPVNRFLMWIFRPIAHEHEARQVNSATWYGTALVVLSFAAPPMICAVAVAVLGLADPVAGVVGRRWGRHRLIHGRSVEGSVAFLLAAFGAGLLVLQLWHRELDLGAAMLVALGAAVPATLAELLSRKIDDNLSVPIIAAAGAWVVLLLL